MFGIKTYLLNRLDRLFLPKITDNVFPDKHLSRIQIRAYLKGIKKRAYTNSRNHTEIGWMDTPAHPLAIETYSSFLPANPNNLGTWTTSDRQLWGTPELERQIMCKMINLFHGSEKNT